MIIQPGSITTIRPGGVAIRLGRIRLRSGSIVIGPVSTIGVYCLRLGV